MFLFLQFFNITENEQGNSPARKSRDNNEINRGGDGDNEYQDKLNQYLATLSEYDKGRYQQLLEKNNKLKDELRNITTATEQILNKERERRRAKYNHEESKEVQDKQKILKEQQLQLNDLKNKIGSKKRELDNAYQYPLVREKEDELKNLKRIYAEHKKEKESVLRIKKEQEKALHGFGFNQEEEERKSELVSELREVKAENKNLHDQKAEMEKALNKNHQKVINSKVYIRDLKKKLEEHKHKSDGHDYKNITEEDLMEMEQKVKDLQYERGQREKKHYEDLKYLEKQKNDLIKENSRLEEKLKEKDKEIRLNKLKMSELKRLQRHKAVKPMDNHSKKLEPESKMETKSRVMQGGGGNANSRASIKNKQKTVDQQVDNLNNGDEEYEYVNQEDDPGVKNEEDIDDMMEKISDDKGDKNDDGIDWD